MPPEALAEELRTLADNRVPSHVAAIMLEAAIRIDDLCTMLDLERARAKALTRMLRTVTAAISLSLGREPAYDIDSEDG